MPRYYLDLDISREAYLRYYRGVAAAVRATDREGRAVRFPASALRGHVTHAGIRGSFCLVTDDDHRLLRLERL
jgi:hypothetical protein